MKLLKFGPKKSVSLFEEYFYGITAAITLAAIVLGRAGGLGWYESAVIGLWMGALLWFGRMFWKYRENEGIKEQAERTKKALQEQEELAATATGSKLKPMIGPQWPLKGNGKKPPARQLPQPAQKDQSSQPSQPGSPAQPVKRPGFVYERPTLPDRPVKMPANWSGPQDKKPKP